MSKRVTILGAGESGIGAAILAQKHGCEVFVSDGGAITSNRKGILENHQIAFEENGHTPDRIYACDVMVKSPGIPDHVTVITNAIARNIEVISEIEFAFRYLDKQAKVIAITGTNGKTTTTLLTYHLLKSAGLNVAVGGNVGTSLAVLVAKGGFDYYVVEVSSFQLDGIVTFKPDVAVLLNITPDHLDRYQNDFDQYVASKFRIVENLSKQEAFIYCADSRPVTEEVARRNIEACLFAVSATKSNKTNAYRDGEHLIFNYQLRGQELNHQIPVADISLIGKHNILNSMSAVLAALMMDVSIDAIVKGLRSFENAPHRMELCGEFNGVKFINDSKATNVDAVYYALDGIEENIIWIAGGQDKGNDYDQIDDLVKARVKGLVCLGVDNQKLLEFFSEVQVIEESREMTDAVQKALAMANPGDVVLLSPACASFDLFKNYEDRGDQFRAAVKSILETKKVRK